MKPLTVFLMCFYFVTTTTADDRLDEAFDALRFSLSRSLVGTSIRPNAQSFIHYHAVTVESSGVIQIQGSAQLSTAPGKSFAFQLLFNAHALEQIKYDSATELVTFQLKTGHSALEVFEQAKPAVIDGRMVQKVAIRSLGGLAGLVVGGLMDLKDTKDHGTSRQLDSFSLPHFSRQAFRLSQHAVETLQQANRLAPIDTQKIHLMTRHQLAAHISGLLSLGQVSFRRGSSSQRWAGLYSTAYVDGAMQLVLNLKSSTMQRGQPVSHNEFVVIPLEDVKKMRWSKKNKTLTFESHHRSISVHTNQQISPSETFKFGAAFLPALPLAAQAVGHTPFIENSQQKAVDHYQLILPDRAVPSSESLVDAVLEFTTRAQHFMNRCEFSL